MLKYIQNSKWKYETKTAEKTGWNLLEIKHCKLIIIFWQILYYPSKFRSYYSNQLELQQRGGGAVKKSGVFSTIVEAN